jgi:hypothetical protein
MTKVEPLSFLLSLMSPPPHIYNPTVLLFRDLKNGTPTDERDPSGLPLAQEDPYDRVGESHALLTPTETLT